MTGPEPAPEPVVTELRVQHFSANDPTCVVLEWLEPDGAPVPASAPVLLVETAKSIHELAAPVGGMLRHAVPVGATCRPGEVVARVYADPAAAAAAGSPAATPAVGDGPLITTAARERAAELGISPERLSELGLDVVRAADVDARLGPEAAPHPLRLPLPAGQRPVASVVSRSHATVPAAFLTMTVDVRSALAEAKSAARRHHVPIGLLELLVTAVYRSHPSWPAAFGRFDPPDAVLLPAAPAVAVALDAGRGLFMPVVTGDATVDGVAVARELLRHKLAAAGGRPAGPPGTGNILVAPLTEPGVEFSEPIVHPDHVCALSLPAPRTDWVPADSQPVARTVISLGLAYDHRVLNGAAAAAFLTTVRGYLEDPTSLLPDGAG